ncbi:MAG TPA: hypothetical protein DCP97_05760 [Ruminococcaceae bacterium]|nr:hypothetical protein [Oscillospiraceae bacterium]
MLGFQKLKIPNKKAVLISISGLVVISSIMTGFTLFNKQEEESGKVYREVKITRGNITVGVNETGTASLRTVNLKWNYDADVEDVYVKAGQQVKKGDPIAKFSVESVETELNKLELNYKKTQLSIQQSELDLKVKLLELESTKNVSEINGKNADSTYDSKLIQLGNDIKTLEDTLESQDNEIENYKDMLDNYYYYTSFVETYEKKYGTTTVGVSSSDAEKYNEAKEWLKNNKMTASEITSKIDSLELSYDANQTKLSNSMEEYEAKLEEARLELEKSKVAGNDAQAVYELAAAQLYNDIALSRISLAEQKDAIDELKEQISDGILKASCDGLVASVNYAKGDTINKGATFATLSDSSNVTMTVAISQDDITNLSLGQAANISLAAYDKQTFTGEIDSISISPARTNTSAISYNVSVKINKGDDIVVFEGMTGDVTFIKKQVNDVLLVSNKAVTSENNKQYITLKSADGSPKKVEVTTGFSDGRNVEITSGVSEGDIALIESVVQTK